MKGQVGIGNLLIFLATIVVAVLAATVFITTASSLQQKAFAVGGEAKERVSATFDVESITGLRNENTNRSIDTLILVVRLAPGAEPVKLDDTATTIQILTPKWQALSIKYSENLTLENITEYTDLKNKIEYGYFYIWKDQSVDRDDFLEILSPGELYTLVIKLEKDIEEEMPVTIKIVSRTGISTTVRFRAPTVIKDPIVQLYP